MNVLSLFDGMSCGQIALNRAGVPYDKYYASEIDKHAMKVTQANYPHTLQLGDVTQITGNALPKIDLLIGGSPCQGFSFAGKQLNFEDPRSALFFEYVRLLKELKPKYFMLENVRMKKEYQDIISSYLGVEPIMINSSLVSAQNRVRLYWTNIPGVVQPKDRQIFLKDIIDWGFVDRDKSYCLDANYFKGGSLKNYLEKSRRRLVFNYSSSGRGNGRVEDRTNEAHKAGALTATGYTNRSFTGVVQINPDKSAGGKQPHMQDRVYYTGGKSPALTASFSSRTNVALSELEIRKLTPVECERLQTVTEGYTDHVSNTQRYKMLGNGWTVDVISHIFKGLLEDKTHLL